MNSVNRNRFRPQLECLEDRALPSSFHGLGHVAANAAAASSAIVSTTNAAATTQRSITDFTSAQGTTSVFTPALPGLPDNVGWTTDATQDPGLFALIDYSGKQAEYLLSEYNIDLGTSVTGTITERPLEDGRVMVTVNLFTRNALAWASAYDPNVGFDPNAELLFGYRAEDLVADPSLTPALVDSHLQVVFISEAGAPMPDLVDAFILGNTPEGVELVSISFRTSGAGTVHDPAGDTEGRLVVSQSGVLFRGGAHFNGARGDGFPADQISIH